MMKKFIFIFIFIFVVISAFSQQIKEKTKANYVFGFCRLLKWQDYYDNKIVIRVYGTNTITDFINVVGGNNFSSGRKVIVENTTLADIDKCNILFISANKLSELDDISVLLAGKPVLIISDKRGYLSSGADVEFDYKKMSDRDSILSYRLNISSIRSKDIKIAPDLIGYSNLN